MESLSKQMHKAPKYFLFISIIVAFASACRKEQITVDSSHNIAVSSDTLWFDTVFTKASTRLPLSVNKQILVYNPYNKIIKTSITLAGGETSHFRLNVDGEPGHTFTDLEIFPNDSIFLFVEVHPSPNNNSPEFNPLIIRDSLVFNTNGNESKTLLIGWGQDAHYIFRDSIETDTSWANSNLPIVVYGYCYVKPEVNLTINQGMQVHFAPSSWLFVEGTLTMQGSKEEPILMQGDRLQPAWEERSGQWGGIWLSYPSYGSTIEHSIIKNGTVGVYCDSTSGQSGTPNVEISKTMIRNMSFDGISGRRSHINVENTISTNCGRFTFFGDGGQYSLVNSTFYTGNRTFSRQDPHFYFRNRTRDQFNRILETYDIEYNYQNNIISGSNEIEFFGDIDISYLGTSTIQYNLIQSTDESLGSLNNLMNSDPKFKNSFKYEFDLDSLSPAKDWGLIQSPVLTDDYCDRPRVGRPDAGAFESQF